MVVLLVLIAFDPTSAIREGRVIRFDGETIFLFQRMQGEVREVSGAIRGEDPVRGKAMINAIIDFSIRNKSSSSPSSLWAVWLS